MTRSAVLGVLIAAGGAAAAPVPRPAPPDPFGNGFFGVTASSEGSLTVDTVDPDSPAGRAGVRPGDVFTAVGAARPRTFAELRMYVGNLRPGTRILVSVRRHGEPVPLTVTVGDRPANLGPFQRTLPVIEEP